MTSDLLPCPFCGTRDHLSIRSEGSMTGDMPSRPYRVWCSHIDHDDIGGPVSYGKPAAITAWNTRAEASQAEVERLTQESADLTKALTGLTRQGSEFFVQRGKRFVADIPACVQDVRERMQRAQQAAVNFAHDKQAAEASATRAEALLEEAGEVLGPFAEACDPWRAADGQYEHDRQSIWEHPVATVITHGDLRAARAFLDKLKEQG